VRETQRCAERYVVAVTEGSERDRRVVLDNRELEAAVGSGRRVQRRGQRQKRVAEILIIFADADREIVKVSKQGGWEIHTRAPRKRIRPLIVSA
jgi:hypothetical protein